MKRSIALFAVLLAAVCGGSLLAGDFAVVPIASEQAPTADTITGVAAAAKPAPASPRFPLRGVVVAVQTGESALMVKHEEIPGVMRAMTMLFKVDAAALQRVHKGATITAQMSRQGSEWWLHDVKVVEEKKG